MARVQSNISRKSTSTTPSTLELPKPVLSSFGSTSVDKFRHDALLKLCEARPGVPPRACELSEALAFLRTIRQRCPSFTSSSSSSESEFPIPSREARAVPSSTPNTVSAGRVIEWRRTLEPTTQLETSPNPKDPWRSFLPSFGSASTSSGVSSEYETCEYPSANVRVEYTPPNQHPSADRRDLYSYHAEDLATEVDEDEDDMWPYDGRGLYEHHPKNECGRACFTSCQLRRKFRPRIAELVRFVPRFWGTKLGEKRKMKNSDIPHPPWTLRYRSNDDSLEEDHDDGDLEVWLESVTEKQKLNHGPQLEVCLDGRPDSRIFSF